MLHTKFREIRQPVSEKIFEGFLPYMVTGPRCHEQTFVPPSYRGSTQNLALIGQTVLEMFEHYERQTDTGPSVYYKLKHEPSAQAHLS